MTMTTTGLRITAIHNQRTGARDLNDEYVIILNESTQAQSLAGYVVTSRTAGRRPDCSYTLPNRVYTEGQSLGGWTCGPGALVFVRSGVGRDQYYPKTASEPAQFHFYMGRRDFAWDIAGDQVYLRHPHGQFVTEPFPVP
jgi:hypothetical protein